MARDSLDARLEAQIPHLRRYAHALVRDRDAADDLVQDCLTQALARWYQRRAEAELRPWLFAILRNLYISSYRTRARRGTQVELDPASDPGQPADQERALVARDALGTLDLLPEEQKSLLLLVGVEELSYAEVARILDIPVGTVMSRLSRARQRLRALLDGEAMPYLRRVK
ncbi:sigma-70 family RNA polymerase sigma factor [Xanthobacter autotrophicus DSM 431]|uniref:RNA polymerase sigma factor n=1 Tax=Xanthobacter nonsaccharivorans TaxID=3119912 RepID=UPI0037279288